MMWFCMRTALMEMLELRVRNCKDGRTLFSRRHLTPLELSFQLVLAQ